MGAAAVAVLIAREKHIVDAFRRVGAFDARSAVTPGSIGVAHRLAFRKLRQHAVLREASPGMFYLDEPSWRAMRMFRRRFGLVFLLVILAAALAVWMSSR